MDLSIRPMLATVYDVGPTWVELWVDVSFLLGNDPSMICFHYVLLNLITVYCMANDVINFFSTIFMYDFADLINITFGVFIRKCSYICNIVG